MKTIIAVLLGVALLGSSAMAAPVNLVRQTEGYTYFNRPGATMPGLYREMDGCLADVIGLSRDHGYGGPVPGLLAAAVVGAMRDGMRMVNLENCMVVRGWRVVRVEDAEGAELSRLSAAELAARLIEWTGSSAPHGALVRGWNNDVAKVDTIKSAMPSLTSRPSLSRLSVPRPAKDGQAPTPRPPVPDWPYKMNIFKPTAPDQLANVSVDSAVLVVTLSNSRPKDFVRLKLVRLGPDGHDPASFTDKKPDTLWLVLPKDAKGAAPGSPVSLTTVYVVPAGRWAIYGVSDVMTACLGAPYFDARPGDVVYTGALDFGVDGIPIDRSLGSAMTALAARPELQARVRTANWMNGARVVCPGVYAYALELPWAPYAEGAARAGSPEPAPAS